MYSFDRYFLNIVDNYKLLREDFIGFSFNFVGVSSILVNLVFAIILVIVLYIIGEKIKSLFIKKNYGNVDVFIDIALGYIFVGLCLLVLGMLGLLYKSTVCIYLIILLAISLYPLFTLKNRLGPLVSILREYGEQFSKNKIINIMVLGFIVIGFLRLIPPETGVDAIWYHTDYPQTYLNQHSMMNVDPKGNYYPIVAPGLGDTLYIITESLSLKDASRYIHFSFYVISIVLYLVVFGKKYSFIPFTALLFVTSPVIIRHTSTAYSEFQWVLCWLLAVYLVTLKKNINVETIILSAVLFGGTLATKLWMLPFYGVFCIYILATNIKYGKLQVLKLLTTFTLFSFLIPILWYFRAFLITGNPLFPTFWNYPYGEPNNPFSLSSIFNFEKIKSEFNIIYSISPLSVFGLVFLFVKLSKSKIFKLFNYPFILFGLILTAIQILINYSSHRFVVPFYSIFAVFLGYGLNKFVIFSKYFKYIFYILFLVLFLYYGINTLLILPYGFGWADQNKYLTRILSRDNSSYFDYENKFSKHFTYKDKVATYGLWGFYYANFDYFYSEDLFRKKERSLSILKKHGGTKFLIKGGNIEWLCKTEKLTDCSYKNYKLLTSGESQYLYELK